MTHRHHIVPKHMGGTNDPSNLTLLTLDEHAEAHRVLWEQHGKLADKMAYYMLSGKTEEGEAVRKEMAREHMKALWQDRREFMIESTSKSRQGLPGVMTGRKHSPEAKEKMRLAKLGKPGTSLGLTRSPETRKRISDTLKAKGIRPPSRKECRCL